MGNSGKLTISLPKELISFADRMARERRISRSQVFSSCLKDLAEREREADMAEGYQALAKEQRDFARMASAVEHEVVPEWK